MEKAGRDRRRAEILDAAMRVAEREGLSGLTIRRLCEELDLSAPIVYRQFKDKEAIIDGLVARLLESSSLPERGGQSLRQWLHKLFGYMRASWQAHPGLMTMMTAAGPFKEDALRTADVVLKALRDAGLSPEEAGAAFHSLMSYLLGSVALAKGTDEAELRAEGLSFASLQECARYLDGRQDSVFDQGLERLLQQLLPDGE
jgi:TetR/AcrR family tetracycline transcriptional repressor